METFDSVRDFWNASTVEESQVSPLKKENVEKLIKSRIKKEKKTVAEYFWASLAFQILIYSFACYLIVSYYSDLQLTGMAVAGIILYIPFTFILMRKFKAMYNSPAANAGNIQANISHQYKLLTEFFSFKKWFDIIAIPVNCFILTGILFKLYSAGGIGAHITGGMFTFSGMLLIFGIATKFENRKHFVKPLKHFEWILQDLKNNE